MGLSLVIDSKKEAEIHIFPADFTGQLLSGETIVANSWIITVSLITGIDSNPSGILFGGPTYTGNVVTQQLQEGIPGCIYRIVTQVTTTLGHILSLETKLAILPDDYPADGTFVILYLTSQPYPTYTFENIHMSAVVAGASLSTTLYIYPGMVDTIHMSSLIAGASLRDTLQTYSWKDTIHMSSLVASAVMNTVLVVYNYNESVRMGAAVVSATMNTVLVIYSNFKDTIHMSSFVASATLTTV